MIDVYKLTIGDTMTDLATLSLAELRTLQGQVSVAIRARGQEDIAEARDKIIEIAKAVGYSVAEIMGSTKKTRKSSGPVPPLYQSKDEPSQQWSGRGRQPKWVKKWIDDGNSLDQIRI